MKAPPARGGKFAAAQALLLEILLDVGIVTGDLLTHRVPPSAGAERGPSGRQQGPEGEGGVNLTAAVGFAPPQCHEHTTSYFD